MFPFFHATLASEVFRNLPVVLNPLPLDVADGLPPEHIRVGNLVMKSWVEYLNLFQRPQSAQQHLPPLELIPLVS